MQPKRIYGRQKSEYSDAARAHIRELKLRTKYKSHDAVVQRNTAKHANRRIRTHAIVPGDQHLLKTATYNASHKKYESEIDFDELPSTSGHTDGRTEAAKRKRSKQNKAQRREIASLKSQVDALNEAMSLSNPQFVAKQAADRERLFRMDTAISIAVGNEQPEGLIIKTPPVTPVETPPPAEFHRQQMLNALSHSNLFVVPGTNYFVMEPLVTIQLSLWILILLKERVQAFYYRDDNSYVMLDKRYAGQRMLTRSYLHLYMEYKQEFPLSKIHRIRFTELKPADIRYPTIRDRRSCQCTHCTNMELLFIAARKVKLTDKSTSLVCSVPTGECYLGTCHECVNKVISHAIANRSVAPFQKIHFKRWRLDKTTTMSRMKIFEESMWLLDFSKELVQSTKKYLIHFWNMISQFRAFKAVKYDSETGTMVVQIDFSQKYTPSNNCEIQNAFVGKHQISLFPIHARIHRLNDTWEMCSIVMVETIYEMKQSPDEVKAYINEFFRLIKPKYWFSEITKVVYLSDGAASQFKTRFNFCNLTYHQLDYGLPAELHFFATSHGKGPCDAIGAVFKRTADGLTNFDQVTDLTTPIFTSLVGEQLNKTQVNYVSHAYIETVRQLNHERQNCMVATTPSQFMMLKSHYFQPTFQEIGQLKVSRHSCSCAMCIATPAGIHCPEFGTQVRTLSLVANKNAIVEPVIPPVLAQPSVSPPPERSYGIGQFVAAVYEADWYVAEVRSLEKDGYFVQFFKSWARINFECAHQRKKNRSSVSSKNMLCVVAPPAPSTSGRSSLLKLTENDYQRVLTAFMLNQDEDVFDSSDED